MSHPSARRDSTEDNSSSSSSSDSNSNSGSNANAGSKSKWHTALDSYSKGVQAWFRDSNESRWFTATLVHREIDESLDRIRFVFERDLPPSLPQHSHVVPTSGVPSSGTSASADAMSLSSSGSFRSVVERSATISTISSPPAASKPSSAVIGRSAAYSSDTIGPDGKGSDDSSTIVFEATFAEIFDSKAKELPYLHNPSVLDGVEDLTNLSHLNEPAVLYNLQERYRRKEIYTYSGVVLVAMNPFTPVPLYSENIMKRYAGKHRSERPPHLFAIAEDAYHGMVLEGKNQTIIVYGESGAGKTTSAKYIMRYYAQAHHAETNDSSMTRVERQILATNPVLESFGNAKTIRNDNSSRFGKYIEIKFGRDRTSIVGAWIRTFLLERSR
ncbi:Myosin type-2 heavy chain 1, partial [Spiromyces aspiralis]